MATYTSNYAWTKPAGSDPVDIGVLNNNLDSQDGIMHDAFLNMAAPFSELSTYAVGDIVLYGTKTYRCRVAVTTAGSWTGATNWDEYKLSEGGLVAGDYVNITNGIINVQTDIGTYDNIRYEFTPTNGGYYVTVTIYINNIQRFQQSYHNDDMHTPIIIENLIRFWYGGDGYYWHYQPLIDSNEHPQNTDIRWYYNDMTVHEETFDVPQDDSTTLVTKGDLDNALDDKVDKVTGKGLSTNDYDNTAKGIVDGVTANLALKADKTATASGETLALVPTSEGRTLLHTAYGMSVQNGTPTPSSPVEIKSAACDWRINNKNLILFPSYKYRYDSGYLRNGITFTYGENGVITFSGTSTARTNMSLMAVGENTLIPIRDGVTYTVWCHRMGTQSNQVYFTDYQFDENLNLVSNSNHTEANTFNVTGSSSCRYLGLNVGIYNTDVTITDARVEIMVIEGRYTSTEIPIVSDNYIPPRTTLITTDLTLRAIEVTSSDAYNLVRDNKYYIADTLDYTEDDGFVVTRRVGVHTLDENSPVTLSGINNNHIANFSFLMADNGMTDAIWYNTVFTLFNKSITNRVLYEAQTQANATRNGFFANGTQFFIRLKDTIANDAASMTTFLQSNPITVQYLITPTTETITTAQALALLGLKTYDESTTISSQAEPSCTVAIEYAKERLGALALTAYNTAKGNDLRITALES